MRKGDIIAFGVVFGLLFAAVFFGAVIGQYL